MARYGGACCERRFGEHTQTGTRTHMQTLTHTAVNIFNLPPTIHLEFSV